MISLRPTFPTTPLNGFHERHYHHHHNHHHQQQNRKRTRNPFLNFNFKIRVSGFCRSGRSLRLMETMNGAAAVCSSSSSASVLITSGASGRVNALLSLRVLRSLVLVINAFVWLLLSPFRIRRRSISLASAEKPKDEKQEFSSNRKVSPVLRVPAAMVSRRSTGSGGFSGEQDVVTRRTIAIKRVMKDEDNDDDDDQTVREASLFDTSRGDTLFTQSWTPVSMEMKGFVVLLHGLNEHSGRYNEFAKQLNSNGFKVYAMDWIGHGGSDGLHAYVHSLDYAVDDMKEFLEKVIMENPGLPCFCFGHSTGAAIVLKAALDPKVETLIQGLVVTSPAVGVQPSHPIVGILAPVLSFLLPKYKFNSAYKKGLPVSRDPAALIAKYSDPLVYTGSVRMRTGYEVLRISSFLLRNLHRFSVPFLVLHGTADNVTDPLASEKLYEEAPSTDKSIKLYDGYLHDLLFEPEREAITEEIIDWLNSRV